MKQRNSTQSNSADFSKFTSMTNQDELKQIKGGIIYYIVEEGLEVR